MQFKLTKCLSLLAISTAFFSDHSLVASAPQTKQGPTCYEVSVPLTVTANTRSLPPDLTLDIVGLLSGILNGLFTTVIHGTFTITGRYCKPEVDIPSRRQSLQILVHPATYDRNWWSGGGYPGNSYDNNRYDWVSYASKRGFPTFAFDRLGNGNSSHPDPISIVQCPTQAEVIHQIVKLARTGAYPFPSTFNKIILAGESLGSIIANIENLNHPVDVDATILAGFSKSWVAAVPGFIVEAGLLPAAIVEPARYGKLPVGYLEASSPQGVAFELFYGPGKHYDEALIAADYKARGTITVGEGVTGALGIVTAPNYKAPVLVMTGQQDVVFCGSTGFEFSGVGDCGNTTSGILAQTKSLYPASRNYTAFHVPNSGHCWMHQYSSQLGFKFAHDWLTDQGL